MSEDRTPASGGLLEALAGEPLEKALDVLVDSRCIEIAAEKVLALLSALGIAITKCLAESLDRADHVSVYFRDRKKHTGLVVVLRGEVLASFTVPTEDGAEGIRRAMRDLGVGGPQTSGSTSSFSSSSAPFRSSPPAASSPFSSSSYPPPPGRSPAPLVRRDDLLWPPDQDEDEDGRNEGDFLPGWSSVR